MGEGQFKVSGSDEPVYYVDLSQDPPCYCKDQEYRGRGCKHELCAKLHSGDPTLILALGEMLLSAEQKKET